MVGGDSESKNKKKGFTYTHPTLEKRAHKNHVARDPMCNQPREIPTPWGFLGVHRNLGW